MSKEQSDLCQYFFHLSAKEGAKEENNSALPNLPAQPCCTSAGTKQGSVQRHLIFVTRHDVTRNTYCSFNQTSTGTLQKTTRGILPKTTRGILPKATREILPKATRGILPRDGMDRIWALPSAWRYHFELNRTLQQSDVTGSWCQI